MDLPGSEYLLWANFLINIMGCGEGKKCACENGLDLHFVEWKTSIVKIADGNRIQPNKITAIP